jgi:creatinine amidohydrolase
MPGSSQLRARFQTVEHRRSHDRNIRETWASYVHAMPPSRLLADLRAPEIAERITETSVIIQPLGAIEQHGPHLPFGTDWFIVDAVARATVEEHGDAHDLWLLPPLAYTKSNEHAWSSGTVWLSATTMLAALSDIARSVAKLPAKRLVFLNGHGGNSACWVKCEIRLEPGSSRSHASPRAGRSWRHQRSGRARDGNQSRGETSMLHVGPISSTCPSPRATFPPPAENNYVKFGGSASSVGFNDFGPIHR